jgi:type I restriction enzyme S subunit
LATAGSGYVNAGLTESIILRLTDLQNDHKSLRTGLATQTGIITSAYTCLKVRQGMLPEYLQLQLHVADLCKVFYGMGGGVRQSIGFPNIKRMLIAVPPYEEQQFIVRRTKEIEDEINKSINNYKEMILVLQEAKGTLISNVVTGKIDVRNVVIPDYEHVDDVADESSEDEEDPDMEMNTSGEEA